MPSLTRAERETIIGYNEESDLVSIYTHDRALMRQLEQRGFGSKRDNVWEGRVVAKSFVVPKAVLSIRLKSTRTAAQRAASREAGKRLAALKNPKKVIGDSDSRPRPATPNPCRNGRAAQ